MSSRQAAPSKPAKSHRSQISGKGKDAFIRDVLQSVPDLEEELAAQVAQHLCGAIDTIMADRSLVERYRQPQFDPNAPTVSYSGPPYPGSTSYCSSSTVTTRLHRIGQA